jgi:hypothetical protein
VRTTTVTNPRPIVARDTQHVVAWLFRVTLEEAGETVYEDLQTQVPVSDRRVFAGWRQSEVWAHCTAAAKDHPAILPLHAILNSRLATQVRPDLKIEKLPE